MQNALRKSLLIGISVVGLSLSAHSAQASPLLPGLTNLNFLNYTGNAPKDTFNNVNPTGWIGSAGPPDLQIDLIFIAKPGTASDPGTACNPLEYLDTYGCPSTLAIPGGYNEVEADGNPVFETGFGTQITGLTAGQTYELDFYQAASQQRGFTGDTTEQWIVGLGNGIMQSDGSGTVRTYSNPDPNASVVATPLMNTPSGGLTDWNFVSLQLKADAPTQILSFLAWGDNGNTTNLPPILFLTGVDSPPNLTTPEPATLSLLGMGILGLAAKRRRRAK